jgi:ADP-ribose pyrophosphatase YjhB (NUDIX family)
VQATASSLADVGIPGVIRPCAFAFVKDGERLLLARMIDPDDGSTYFRPLGGGIEFGENGEEAVRREFREELGVELGSVRHLGFLENLFEMGGEPYHELCLIFVAEPDGWPIERFDGYVVPESVGPGGGETAVVRTFDEFGATFPLYPEGVIELVASMKAASQEASVAP